MNSGFILPWLVRRTKMSPPDAALGRFRGRGARREMMDGSVHGRNDRPNGTNPSSNEGLKPFMKLAAAAKRAYLTESDGEKLRRLIEGTVASMTADKLSTRYDRGLEHDRLYQKALDEFRFLILNPRTDRSPPAPACGCPGDVRADGRLRGRARHACRPCRQDRAPP